MLCLHGYTNILSYWTCGLKLIMNSSNQNDAGIKEILEDRFFPIMETFLEYMGLE